MSTSDKFPPLAEPIDERYAGFVEEAHAPLSDATVAPPSVVDNPSEKIGHSLLEVGLAAATWIASIILLVVMSAVFVIPYAFRQVGMNQQLLSQFLLTDKTAIFLQILSTIPAHLLTLGVIWAVVTRFGKRPFWATLGWSWGRNFNFWTSAGLAVGLLALGMLITYKFHGGETQLDKLISSSTAARYTTAFLATFTAPLVEEMVYRGVLYSALQRFLTTVWGVFKTFLAGSISLKDSIKALLSPSLLNRQTLEPIVPNIEKSGYAGTVGAVTGVMLLFTLIHVPQYWPNFGVIAVIGILSFSLTVVRAYTGRLLPCFIIHLVFNGISSILIILEPYVPQLNSGGEQKAESFIMLARILRLSL